MREAFCLFVEDVSSSVVLSWNPRGCSFAVGGKGRVHIVDHHGNELNSFELNTNNRIIFLDWNREGSTLAILQEGTGDIVIWDEASNECSTLDMPIDDPTALTWGKAQSHLAIGTSSGNVLLYKEFAETPISIMGVLSSSISFSVWDCYDSFLAIASANSKSLVILNEEGENFLQLEMRFPPVGLEFSSASQSTSNFNSAICVNSGGKFLYVKLIDSSCAPLEHSLRTRGIMVKSIWVEGMILVGFVSGELALFSTTQSSDRLQINEMWSMTSHEVAPLLDLQYMPNQRRIVAVGNENLSFLDYFEETRIPLVHKDMSICSSKVVNFSPEGNLLCLAESGGKLQFYMNSLMAAHASNGSHLAFMSSLVILTYVNTTLSKSIYSLTLPFEPKMLATGLCYVAVTNESTILVYSKATQEIIFKNDCIKPVSHIHVNSKYIAFLSDSVLYIYDLSLPLDKKNDGVLISFDNDEVTHISMTEHFIVVGTSKGAIQFVSLAHRILVESLRYQHARRIKYLLPSPNGTRVLVVDADGKAFFFLPSAQTCLQFAEFPKTFDRILWDVTDTNVVNVIDGVHTHCYIYIHSSIRGAMITKLGQVQIDEGGGITIYPAPFQIKLAAQPIICNNGEFVFVDNNQLCFAKSPFYSNGERSDGAFAAFLALLKFDDAWKEALKIDEQRLWFALASKALEVLEIDVAIHVYRWLNDAGMVLTLEKLQPIEDKQFLSGYILMIFMEYDSAQDLFLKCKREDIAIKMRMDILQFDEALSLASDSCLDTQIFDVSLRYGQYLESIGKYERSLSMYETAFNVATVNESLDLEACSGGFARSAIYSGNFERGFSIAKQIKNVRQQLFCAELLLSYNQLMEAASLFEHCQEFDKAAEVYLSIKHVAFLIKIGGKVTSAKLLSEIGSVFEEAGRNKPAMEAYERAGEIESFIRISLSKGGDFGLAIDMVKRHNSIIGAKLLIEYCLQQVIVDYRTVVELMVMTGQHDDAFLMAKRYNLVDFFAASQSSIDPVLAIKVAKHFEEQRQLGKAGQFYRQGGQNDRAMGLYMEGGENYLNEAIELASSTKDPTHIKALIDYLSGNRDGNAKDSLHICKLYLTLENYEAAVEIVSSISQNDQYNGEYSKAHIAVSNIVVAMERKSVFVPHYLRSMFIILHSYQLVKFHAKRANHQCSANLLLRVVEHLDQFPRHKYEVLVSTVIECLKAGLLKSAHIWASHIYKNMEFREKLMGPIKKKIETCVRRPMDQEFSNLTPSPCSGAMMPEMSLICPITKEKIPMCCLTGRHMELDNWCFCPVSGMPVLFSEYTKFLKAEDSTTAVENSNQEGCQNYVADPIFGKEVNLVEVIKVSEDQARQYILRYNGELSS